jgi:hypothetical protein
VEGVAGGMEKGNKEHLLGKPLTQAAGVYCDELRPDLHQRRKVLTNAMEGIGSIRVDGVRGEG